jgi:hypothetical protein
VTDRIAFVEALVGTPYRLGAQGPDAWDCWSLTRHVQQELFGRRLASVEVPADKTIEAAWWLPAALAERRRWTEIARPEDGCLITMTQGVERTHTGTWLDLDRGLVIHTLPEQGGSLDRLLDLEAVGWAGFRFWRPAF